jgi:methylmalonyl-CoA/ethylmalonyl-CoA epimerase
MFEKISHIGIAVKNIDEKLKVFRDVLGMKVGQRIKVPDQGVEVCFLEFEGTDLELLQPLNDKTSISKFLEKKGEGQHHISFEVEDLKAALKELEAKGVELIDKEPRIGAAGYWIAFLHPKSTGGILIELEQKKE